MEIGKRTQRVLLVVAEVALVLIIMALLLAVWMPALVGPHPNRELLNP